MRLEDEQIVQITMWIVWIGIIIIAITIANN